MKILNRTLQRMAMINLFRKTYSGDKNRPTMYVKQIIALRKLLCYKCRNEIKIGDMYSRQKSGQLYSKYYHVSCYERLFQ